MNHCWPAAGRCEDAAAPGDAISRNTGARGYCDGVAIPPYPRSVSCFASRQVGLIAGRDSGNFSYLGFDIIGI